MHASIWRFGGDPDDLLRRYDAVVAEIPAANMRLHLCLRADDGIIVVDTCPDPETYQAFVAGAIADLFHAHGLPAPESVEDYPVQAAFVDGSRR
jgi:hypothetical protein